MAGSRYVLSYYASITEPTANAIDHSMNYYLQTLGGLVWVSVLPLPHQILIPVGRINSVHLNVRALTNPISFVVLEQVDCLRSISLHFIRWFDTVILSVDDNAVTVVFVRQDLGERNRVDIVARRAPLPLRVVVEADALHGGHKVEQGCAAGHDWCAFL